MDNIRFYQPPLAKPKNSVQMSAPFEATGIGPLEMTDIRHVSKSVETCLSNDAVLADEVDGVPSSRSAFQSELGTPTDDDYNACSIRSTGGMIDVDKPRVESAPSIVFDDHAVVTTHDFSRKPDASSEQSATRRRHEWCPDDHSENGSLQSQPERTAEALDCLKHAQTAQSSNSNDQSGPEIPETQVEPSVEDGEILETRSGKSNNSKASKYQICRAGESLDTARRWSFPGLRVSSAHCGNKYPPSAQCRGPSPSPAAVLSKSCKKVGNNELSHITPMDHRGMLSGCENSPRASTGPKLNSQKKAHLVSLSFSSTSNRDRQDSHNIYSSTDPVQPSVPGKHQVLNETMPPSVRTSPLITIHPLAPGDALFLTALVDDSKLLTELSTSLAAWNLPHSLSSERLNVISIKVLGDKSWLVLAKISNNVVANSVRVSSGALNAHSSRLPPKRKGSPSDNESDLDLMDDDGNLPELQILQRRRQRHARPRIVASNDSQSDSDTTASPDIKQAKIKRGRWTKKEDLQLTRLVEAGSPWAAILARFPHRSEPAVRSRWNCVLKGLAS